MQSKARHSDRSGSALLIVLGAAMLVALLGLAGLMALRIQRRVVEDSVDSTRARAYAQAAVEVGLMRIADDENWRTTYTDGVWVADQPLGDGTFTLEGHDPLDGDLADDETDEIVLTGIGVQGAARQKTLVRLVPQLRGVGALETSLFAAQTLTITTSIVQSDGVIGANGDVTASGSTVAADVESGGSISGSTYNGGQTSGLDPRTMPPDAALSPYTATGVFIDVTNLPASSSTRYLRDLVLSPNSNPYGAAHAQGIYIIDCQGNEVVVSNVRIVGTLVLLNVHPTLGAKVADSVNWTASVSNYPALLVDGKLTLGCTQAPLDEATLTVNFNPAGTPYLGAEDSDTADTYSSAVEGLIYASGDIDVTNYPAVKGSVVAGGAMLVNGQLDLVYDDVYLTNPPPGFLDRTKLTVAPGSWSRDVD